MEPTESQLKKLKGAYKKGMRYALVKMGHSTIRLMCKEGELEKEFYPIMDQHPNVYSIEDIYILIN